MLLTHPHYDNFSESDIERVRTDETVLVAPVSMKKLVEAADHFMRPGDMLQLEGFDVLAVPAHNVDKKFHSEENGWLGYVFTIGDTTYYHAGDTGLPPGDVRDPVRRRVPAVRWALHDGCGGRRQGRRGLWCRADRAHPLGRAARHRRGHRAAQGAVPSRGRYAGARRLTDGSGDAGPVAPVPAATLALLRDAEHGIEVLLLKRNARAGFVPETYVFPGGRVDPADALTTSLPIGDLTPEIAAARLSLPEGDPPAIAYYVAALREAFEETGIVVGVRGDGSEPPTAAADPVVDRVREDLMEGRIGFEEALASMACRLSGEGVRYFAHWITPRRQPRRFDTRFFAAPVGSLTVPIVDAREMTEARWIAPERALDQHARGNLPMIRPTVWTLEKLTSFGAVQEALEGLVSEPVVTILPDD